MPQDKHQQAIERYADCKEAWRDQQQRMREDLRFSNPSDPKQWDDEVLTARQGRVCLTLDRTNQYIVQVVNDARKNKPGITTMPADSQSDVEVAKRLDGIIRHIEYRSRAPIAYDTAIEHSARCGVGWLRIIPEVVRADTNQQDITIRRVHDPLSIVLDPDSTEPDGSDAMFGFAETSMSERTFKKEFPKAKPISWQTDRGDVSGWLAKDAVRVCEYQYIVESQTNMIVAVDPDGEELTLSEDDYWTLAGQIGYKPQVAQTFKATERKVKWCKLNGAEVLDETEFPSRWIGMIPVVGFELWSDGQRYMCGETRRMMNAQKAYNYERSAMVEAVAVQPKAPILTPAEAVGGYEAHWANLNTGNPGFLPYNHVDANGNPIPPPARLAPPAFPVAFAQGGQLALADMEASVGIYRANLGAPSNETSGRAIRERKEQGDTASFHFVDNLSRSIEHLGRMVVDMIPRLYDTKRQARILGIDGQHDSVQIDPEGPAVQRQGRKVVSINPGVGAYDVRVIAGANYTTQRQEAAEGIAEVLQAAPQFAPVLGPALVKLRDWPDADKYSRALLALAPPEVQSILGADDNEDQPQIPPQIAQQLQAMQQQMQQMSQMLDAGEQELQRLEQENQGLKQDKSIQVAKLAGDTEAAEAKESVDRYNAETARLKVLASPSGGTKK